MPWSPTNLTSIEVDSPPTSPPAFDNSSDDACDLQNIVSPSKRTRRGVTTGQKHTKRLKVGNRLPSFEQVIEPTDFNNHELIIDGYQAYTTAVKEKRAGFYQLRSDLFAVQGWDGKTSCVQNHWYHLQRVVVGNDVHIACVCPQGKGILPLACEHEKFIREYYSKDFEQQPTCHTPNTDKTSVTLFARQQTENGCYQNWFSVTCQQLSSHAVVMFDGTDNGKGTWTCMKENGSQCRHVLAAEIFFRKLLVENGQIYEPRFVYGLNQQHDTVVNGHDGGRSVSHQSVMPPAWCSLPTDNILYERHPPMANTPPIIRLDKDSRCACNEKFNGSKPTSRTPCRIYTLTHVLSTEIELQSCPACKANQHQFIGPDARNLGIFNLNNRLLFTHDLLDEYTSAFTASETPFVAWVSVINRRYVSHNSTKPFVSEDTFRTAWFAYIRLQSFDNDTTCAICGPNPATVIWDGVTVAFNKKKLLPSLQPPTSISDKSPIRSSICYQAKQQLIKDREVRMAIRRLLAQCKRNGQTEDNRVSGEDKQTLTNDTEAFDDTPDIQTLANVPEELKWIEEKLYEINWGLGTVFSEKFGSKCNREMRLIPAPYYELLRQISSEDSVLRLATRNDRSLLREFVSRPTTFHASQLVVIPALYNVLNSERIETQSSNGLVYSEGIVALARWIFICAEEVYTKLSQKGAPLLHSDPIYATTKNPDNWRKTGTYYSLSKIRHRPVYPKLRYEQSQKSDSGNRGGKCSKYFAQYGKTQLTGGIMGAWCTHVICYGFHCIPNAEGRDDVFSAMVTRWPSAPKIVIYDFACALGPYCMLREPAFFENTKFLIDRFHTSNHTKCDEAWFLSTYAAVDPHLSKLNSSAAECGNNGLNRIRTSISYMSQSRAIIYTKVFLAVWNRNRLKKQSSTILQNCK